MLKPGTLIRIFKKSNDGSRFNEVSQCEIHYIATMRGWFYLFLFLE